MREPALSTRTPDPENDVDVDEVAAHYALPRGVRAIPFIIAGVLAVALVAAMLWSLVRE